MGEKWTARDDMTERELALSRTPDPLPETWPGGLGHSANRTPLERGLERTHEAEAAYVQELQDILDRTPQEREAAARAADEPSVPEWAKAMFDAQGVMIEEQAERIDALENSIAELTAQRERDDRIARDLRGVLRRRIDEQADIIDQLHVANKHLAGRIDNLDMAVARIIGMLPSAGTPTIQQQRDAVTYRGPTEEGESD